MASVTEYSPVGLSAHHALANQKARRLCLIAYLASFLLLIIAFSFVLPKIIGFSHRNRHHVAAVPDISPPDDSFRRGPLAIAAACNVTLYPSLCFSSLSSYPSAFSAPPPLLVAISTTLALRDVNRTYDVALSLSKGQGSEKEIAAVTDCIELMGDARDQLKLATARLLDLDLNRTRTQLKDVKMWVSAALTYETTCSDGFEDISGTVSQQMLREAEALSKMVSIALALVAHLSDHLVSWRSSTISIPPSTVRYRSCL